MEMVLIVKDKGFGIFRLYIAFWISVYKAKGYISRIDCFVCFICFIFS
jgi:hypothetical protein